MIRWLTAGDSHGPEIVGVLDGLPPGAPVGTSTADRLLRLRAAGFGRSRRQRLERDGAEIRGGVWKGVATGAPLLVRVTNAGAAAPPDQDEWRARPGHADLAGSIRTGLPPAAVAERASGRETAARVALGGVALDLLGLLGVEVDSWSEAIGGVEAASAGPAAPDQPLRWPDGATEAAAREAISEAGGKGTTLGGRVAVEARGVPTGLGEADHPDSRLSATWPAALFSIPSVRAVELGDGTWQAGVTGAEAIDEPLGETNAAGGIEGGRTTGRPLRARLWSKPIPTQRSPLASVDLRTGEPAEAPHVRSDVTVVPALAVVAQAVTSLVLLQTIGHALGSATWGEWAERWDRLRESRPDWLPG